MQRRAAGPGGSTRRRCFPQDAQVPRRPERGAVTGFAHRTLRPAHRWWAHLTAVCTRCALPRGARHADRATLTHEVARSFPIADATRGHRALEADVTKVAESAVGPLGDLAHSSAHRARAPWPGSTHRAQGTSGWVSPIDHLDQAARSTLAGQLSSTASVAYPAFRRRDQPEIPPSTTHAERFGQIDSARPQGDDEATHRRGCADQQCTRPACQCLSDRAQRGRSLGHVCDHLRHDFMGGRSGDGHHRVDHHGPFTDATRACASGGRSALRA